MVILFSLTTLTKQKNLDLLDENRKLGRLHDENISGGGDGGVFPVSGRHEERHGEVIVTVGSGTGLDVGGHGSSHRDLHFCKNGIDLVDLYYLVENGDISSAPAVKISRFSFHQSFVIYWTCM